ncbi:MAG: sensor histidine kinase, partial [Salinirussus sp.]
KVRERRLEVLTRVLNHNMRNSMNVIEGHAELLSDEFDEIPESLSTIARTASDLMGLADAVRDIERTLRVDSRPEPIDLEANIRRLISGFQDRYPSANFELSVAGNESTTVDSPGVLEAVEEAIENAIKHNDSPSPSVAIRLDATEPGWLGIEIADNGQGIPEREIEVLRQGETPLDHADRLGLWLIYWVVSRAGGTFDVAESDEGGTLLSLSIPSAG